MASSPGTPGALRHWERQGGLSPGACRGSETLGPLDATLLAPRTVTNLPGFRPPCGGYFFWPPWDAHILCHTDHI